MQNPEEDLRAFVGPNADYYLQAWAAADPNGGRQALRWNWPAFFLNVIWMLYRKMYLQAAVTFVIFCMPGVNIILHILVGAFANYLYYKHAKAKILETRPHLSEQALYPALKVIGGVHSWAITVGIVFGVVLVVTLAFFFAAISTFMLGMMH